MSDKDQPLASTPQPDDTSRYLITRRGFVGLAVSLGMTTLVANLHGGNTLAYADELSPQGVVLHIISREEAAFTFKDIADPKAAIPLAGAKVEVYSHCKEKMLPTATTDAQGAALLNIRNYSEPQDKKYSEISYQFWGKITVSLAGYRTFETGLLRVQGANRIDIPTLKTSDSDRYFQCLTFNDYDIQYASDEDAAFLTSNEAKEPAQHKLFLKLYVGKSGGSYKLGYNHGPRAKDSIITDVKVHDEQSGLKPDADGFVTATFSDIYLGEVKGKNHCFFEGLQTDVYFEQEGSARRGTCCTNLSVHKGCLPDVVNTDTPLSTKLFTIKGSPSGLDLSSVFDSGLPVLGGASVNVWYPTFPVNCVFSPFGKLALGIGAGRSASLKDSSGNNDDSRWKWDPVKNAKEQVKDKFDKMNRDYASYKTTDALRRSEDKRFGKIAPVKNTEIKVSFDGLLNLDWAERKEPDGSIINAWGGGFDFTVGFNFSFSYTAAMTVGCVPVFLTFDFSANADAGGNITVSTPEAGTSGFSAYMTGTGITVDLKLEVALTLGVGIPGVLSGGARGFGYIRFYLGFVVPPEDKNFPHALIGAGFGVQLVFQIAVFKINVDLYHKDYPTLADTWKSSSQNAAPQSNDLQIPAAVALPLSGQNATGALLSATPLDPTKNNAVYGTVNINDVAVPVTQAELAALKEYVGANISTSNGEEEYSFNAVDHYTNANCNGFLISNARGLGVEGCDAMVLHDVFSDPRSNVISMGTNTYMFRLASVQYDDGAAARQRSRVCAAKLVNGTWIEQGPVHYEYSPETRATVQRSDIFDYDFDVVCNPAVNRIYLIVIGGTRSSDADATLNVESQKTIVMCVVLDANLNVVFNHECLDYYKPLQIQSPTNDSATYSHALMFPRAVLGVNNTIAIGFLHRRIPAGASFFDGTTPAEDFPAIMVSDIDGNFHSLADGTCVFESPEASTSLKKDVRLHLYGEPLSKGVVFSFITYDMQAHLAAEDDGDITPATAVEFMAVKPPLSAGTPVRVTNLAPVEGVSIIRPWDTAGNSIAKKGKELCEISVGEDDEGALVATVHESFADGFGVDTFDVSSDGNLVYYTKISEGKDADTIADDGTMTPVSDVELYQVFAARKVRYKSGQKIISPYPYARLTCAPDHIVSFNGDNQTCFLYSNITDFENSKADLYYVGVPVLKKIDLIAFESVNSFVCADTDEPLLFTVKNNGNTVITEFDVAISVDNTLIDTLHVKIDPTNTLFSNDDVQINKPISSLSEQEDGSSIETLDDNAGATQFTPCEVAFDVPTESGVLLPGVKRTYRVDFHIPKSWQDDADKGQQEKKLEACIVDNSIKLADQGDDGYSELPEILAASDSITMTGYGLNGSETNPVEGIMAVAAGSNINDETDFVASSYYYTENGNVKPAVDPNTLPKTGDTGIDTALTATLAAALGLTALGIGIAGSSDKADETAGADD